jgi:hypothetical protein
LRRTTEDEIYLVRVSFGLVCLLFNPQRAVTSYSNAFYFCSFHPQTDFNEEKGKLFFPFIPFYVISIFTRRAKRQSNELSALFGIFFFWLEKKTENFLTLRNFRLFNWRAARILISLKLFSFSFCMTFRCFLFVLITTFGLKIDFLM